MDARRFVDALRAAELVEAEARARDLLAAGLPLVDFYEILTTTLYNIGDLWAAGRLAVADEHRVTATAQGLIARLRGAPTPAYHGTVVLATLEGERHTLGLDVIGHLLEASNFRVVVGGELPASEIATLAGRYRDLLAVGIGMQAPPARGAVRRPIGLIREASKDVRIVLGGRAFTDASARTSRHGADAVVDGARATLRLLEAWASPLSPRESEVLRAVADGMTNAQAARRLGVSAETVKAHLDSVFLKLSATGRASAVAKALRRGWLR